MPSSETGKTKLSLNLYHLLCPCCKRKHVHGLKPADTTLPKFSSLLEKYLIVNTKTEKNRFQMPTRRCKICQILLRITYRLAVTRKSFFAANRTAKSSYDMQIDGNPLFLHQTPKTLLYTYRQKFLRYVFHHLPQQTFVPDRPLTYNIATKVLFF